MGKRKALGRGLEALLPASVAEALSGREVVNIPIGKVHPNPDQPRKDFDEDSLASLAESIKAQGVLQPILVHPDNDEYQVVAGERRLRASEIAGLPKIPALVISEAEPSVLYFFSLVENLQREDLSPLEEAQAYKHLMDEFDLTQEAIAGRVGKSRSAVANTLRLLSLPEEVKELLTSRKITAGHARAILAAGDEERMIRLAKLAARRGLSVERLEILAREDRPSPRHRKKKKSKKRKRKRLTAEQSALRDALVSHLATKVDIDPSDDGGRIIIEFYSEEDLERIAALLAED